MRCRRLVRREFQLPLHLHPLGQFHQLRNVSAQRIAGGASFLVKPFDGGDGFIDAHGAVAQSGGAGGDDRSRPRAQRREVHLDFRRRKLRRPTKSGFIDRRKTSRRIRERLEGTAQRAEIMTKGITRRIAEIVKRIGGQRGALQDELLAQIELEPAGGERETIVRIDERDRRIETHSVGQRQARAAFHRQAVLRGIPDVNRLARRHGELATAEVQRAERAKVEATVDAEGRVRNGETQAPLGQLQPAAH